MLLWTYWTYFGENCFATVFSFNTMQGVSFWEVNGSEHLLRIVVIVIQRLRVAEVLQFVWLEGHYHMLLNSDGVARMSNCWATFPPHGIDLQSCILYS